MNIYTNDESRERLVRLAKVLRAAGKRHEFQKLPMATHSGDDEFGFEFDVLPGGIRVSNKSSVERAIVSNSWPQGINKLSGLNMLLRPFGDEFGQLVHQQILPYRRPGGSVENDGITCSLVYDIIWRFADGLDDGTLNTKRQRAMGAWCMKMARAFGRAGLNAYADDVTKYKYESGEYIKIVRDELPRLKDIQKLLIRGTVDPINKALGGKPHHTLPPRIMVLIYDAVIKKGYLNAKNAFKGSNFPIYAKLTPEMRLVLDHHLAVIKGIAMYSPSRHFRLNLRDYLESLGYEIEDNYMRVIQGGAK